MIDAFHHAVYALTAGAVYELLSSGPGARGGTNRR
jgi:hypothetical protein